MSGYTIVGYVVVVAGAIIAASIAVAWTWHYINSSLEKRRDLIRYEKARDIGNEILTASWWFDTPDTVQMAKVLGMALTRYGGFRPDQVRKEWRQWRKDRDDAARKAIEEVGNE